MINSVFLVIFGIIVNNGGSSGQVLQFGDCADVKTMEYFEIERFLGVWHEIERFPTWYENYGVCAYKRILYCGRNIEIEHYYIKDGIQYVLHVNSTYAPGDEAVFAIQQNNIDPVGIPISIISTDYNNYAIAYGCKHNQDLGIKYISAWILSRNSTLQPEVRQRAIMEVNSLPYASVAYLETVPQSEEDCEFHWTAHVQSWSLNDAQ